MKFSGFLAVTIALFFIEATASFAAESGSAATAAPPELLEAMSDFCKETSPPEPKFIEHVDGFLNTCGGFLQSCVDPLLEGYRYVEFEIDSEEDRRGLPSGIYRAEIAESSSDLCGPYIAATLREITRGTDRLASKKKCVALSKVAKPSSKYKRSISSPQWPSAGKLVIATGESVIRIEDGATVAAAQYVSARTENGDATLQCGANRDILDLYRIVIPPSVYAPFR